MIGSLYKCCTLVEKYVKMAGKFTIVKNTLVLIIYLVLVFLMMSAGNYRGKACPSNEKGHLFSLTYGKNQTFLLHKKLIIHKNNYPLKDVKTDIQNKIRMYLPDDIARRHFVAGCNQHQIPVDGRIDFIENFPSKLVNPRNIEVWLPEAYDPSKKYAVIYAHDGQMLYDSTKSWNGQAWDIDDVAGEMMRAGKIRDLIVVGIWNDGANRFRDYFPQKPFESLSKTEKAFIQQKLQESFRVEGDFSPNSDFYLQFIVQELKPWIDAHYATLKDPANTIILGSSMGGLISFYAITQYPEVFGRAVCMSTHWPGIFGLENNPVPDAFLNYADAHLSKLDNHKVFFDLGDQGLDSLYTGTQQKIDQLMMKHGFNETNWQTIYAAGETHTETSWNKRLPTALKFILN